MKRLVVIGGGIAGLAAARAASELSGQVPGGLVVVVLERERELGGKAQSLREGEWLFEAGPSGWQGSEPDLERLIERAGLSGEVIEAAPEAAQGYVLHAGRLRLLAAQPLDFARSGVLGPVGYLRAACEPWIRPRRDGADESVHDFVERRLGRQVAERLAAPMLQGIFAGDARRLSLPAAWPKLHELEQRHGSLRRGLSNLKQRQPQAGVAPEGSLRSLRGGLQSLALALARSGDFSVRSGTRASGLARDGKGWRVAVEGADPLAADALVLAGEAWSMAGLVQETSPDLARDLAGIVYPPVAVVGLGYAPSGLERVPRGHGALIPSAEGLRILGCLWESQFYAARAPAGHLLVRCTLGGTLDPAASALREDELVAIARADLACLLGIQAAPVWQRVARWPRAIPQFELGHLARVKRIQQAIEKSFGLYLAGNYLCGPSFPRAAASGSSAGEAAARWLAQR